ncbi:hypothetical protein [Rhodococcus sp. UNC363MFTsu5.1]|uniref:hypothetical protein n=1 Tax=Rhodococcus sp. UNC363MFTsu5.1 TaxID=1449069 RepID=UPI001E5F1051|nr:hypothetical protein [Rhodococcus sp. UNC363MFTsu5.1]
MTSTENRRQSPPARRTDQHDGTSATWPQPPIGESDGGVDGVVIARAVIAFVAGLALLVLAFANLDTVVEWASKYGRVWVYLGFFLVMSIAGRLFWWGTDTVIGAAVTGRRQGPRQ